MKIIEHDVDPTGDLLIVLKHPNTVNLKPDLYNDDEEEEDDEEDEDCVATLPIHNLHLGSPVFDLSGNEEVAIQFRVSSHHMARGSVYFDRMLKGPWKESIPVSLHFHQVYATDWNSEAFAVVLYSIHDLEFNHIVPPSVTKEFIAHVAVVGDDTTVSRLQRKIQMRLLRNAA